MLPHGVAPAPFVSATVILPVINEVQSLATTIDSVEQSSGGDVGEYLLVVCARTSPESLEACRRYERRDLARFRVLLQTRPYLGGAMRDAFDAARSSHVVLMASDLETDPAAVPQLIARAKERPGAIVTCSRWIGGAGFTGYHPVKLVLNRIFQRAFSILYGTRLTDMTFGFRIFPRPLVQAIRWDELKHPLLFETVLKPLRLGVEVVEIPSSWTARREGTSQGGWGVTLAYVLTGLRVRFLSRRALLAESRDE